MRLEGREPTIRADALRTGGGDREPRLAHDRERQANHGRKR